MGRGPRTCFALKSPIIMRMKQRSFLATGPALLCLLLGGIVSADPRTVNDGVYTEDQADVGEVLYKEHCMLCHDKKYFRPVLKRWEGQPLSIMFTVMSTSMPESNPGYLSQKEYVDILAYILSLSRYAAGDTELDQADGALNELMVEARQRK